MRNRLLLLLLPLPLLPDLLLRLPERVPAPAVGADLFQVTASAPTVTPVRHPLHHPLIHRAAISQPVILSFEAWITLRQELQLKQKQRA